MGQPLSNCSPNHIDARQAYEQYRQAKLNGKEPNHPFCCRYHPELEDQREKLEREKFRRLSKQTHNPSTQTPATSNPESTFITPSTITRYDRVSNGALIQQSKRTKSKTIKKQLKQNKPHYPPPPRRKQSTKQPTPMNTPTSTSTIPSEVHSISFNEMEYKTPSSRPFPANHDDIFEAELEMSGSASELFGDEHEHDIDSGSGSSNLHSTKVNSKGYIQSESLVITTCDDLYEHPLMADDDSNGSGSLTTSPTSMINNGRLSVSMGYGVGDGNEKKWVLRLTSPSLNEYELTSHGLPITPDVVDKPASSSDEEEDIEIDQDHGSC